MPKSQAVQPAAAEQGVDLTVFMKLILRFPPPSPPNPPKTLNTANMERRGALLAYGFQSSRVRTKTKDQRKSFSNLEIPFLLTVGVGSVCMWWWWGGGRCTA